MVFFQKKAEMSDNKQYTYTLLLIVESDVELIRDSVIEALYAGLDGKLFETTLKGDSAPVGITWNLFVDPREGPNTLSFYAVSHLCEEVVWCLTGVCVFCGTRSSIHIETIGISDPQSLFFA